MIRGENEYSRTMGSTLNDLCKYMYSCAEKLEEEIKININDCLNMITNKEATDLKVALEKVKDDHYNEILKLLSDIITNVRKIIYHEDYIKKLTHRKSVSNEEIDRCHFSPISTSMQDLNINKQHRPPISASLQDLPREVEKVVRREKRRVVSQVSVYSLEAWEAYLNKKEALEASIPVVMESSTIGRRNKQSKRKQKKFISSTFNDILDDIPSSMDDECHLHSGGSTGSIIREESEEELAIHENSVSGEESDLQKTESSRALESSNFLTQNSGHGYPIHQAPSSESEHPYENESEGRKPKIVDVVYKKR
ncbi:hypothetical protein JTB14_002652 [Gonioctena quinquepunctata]|nr:hypothetical protein JTB14_002652 [Gonioctena quinquepunctata]